MKIQVTPFWRARKISYAGYRNDVVEPMLRRLKEDPYSLDLAISATILVWQSLDHIAKERNISLSCVRALFRDSYNYANHLQAAATVFKHAAIETNPASFVGLDAVIQPSSILSASTGGVSVSEKIPCRLVFSDGFNIAPYDLLTDSNTAINTINLSLK
ncbi:hypothetical protein RAH32_08360 [Paracoccus sp. WLY502]|uniref:hypothetical protein n=1 Tax=Paracoccus yibinensis TaxID=3068891 RepID=UPI0027964EE3|nr:hypothetical protein [Paracoccus sp. WLY502]MDQ1900456.1 hypothetical protein [Paracoccus sp. WLY502]